MATETVPVYQSHFAQKGERRVFFVPVYQFRFAQKSERSVNLYQCTSLVLQVSGFKPQVSSISFQVRCIPSFVLNSQFSVINYQFATCAQLIQRTF